MSYHLLLGDRSYSSWSLRGWLLFERFGIALSTSSHSFERGHFKEALAEHPPARTMPTLITPEGAIVGDSLAIAEELATRHPEAGIWPDDPLARATARTLAAEMHSGFTALRGHCPMNLRRAYSDFPVPDTVQADLQRLEEIWSHAFGLFGGPWLCGEYSAADVFFAPVAARIAGYGLPVGDQARAYVDRHLADPAFRRWRAMGLVAGPELPVYTFDFALRDWPGPAPRAAEPADGPSINAQCPYSGRPVTDFLRLDGQVYGFCNPFCRDKTMADPAAWPAFMAMLETR